MGDNHPWYIIMGDKSTMATLQEKKILVYILSLFTEKQNTDITSMSIEKIYWFVDWILKRTFRIAY